MIAGSFDNISEESSYKFVKMKMTMNQGLLPSLLILSFIIENFSQK